MPESKDENNRVAGPAVYLFGSLVRIAITLTSTVVASVTLAAIVQNQFFAPSESGWALDEETTQTVYSVKVLEKVFARSLEVGGDIRVTGSELQMVQSECSQPAAQAEGQLCFDGEHFMVSENGSPFAQLEGKSGEQGPPGPAGPAGPGGPAGGTARLWLPANQTFSLGTPRELTLIGSGFPTSTEIRIARLSPNGTRTQLAPSVTTTAAGTFSWAGNSGALQLGNYALVAEDSRGTVLATHPFCLCGTFD